MRCPGNLNPRTLTERNGGAATATGILLCQVLPGPARSCRSKDAAMQRPQRCTLHTTARQLAKQLCYTCRAKPLFTRRQQRFDSQFQPCARQARSLTYKATKRCFTCDKPHYRISLALWPSLLLRRSTMLGLLPLMCFRQHLDAYLALNECPRGCGGAAGPQMVGSLTSSR